jgi:type VI secretion system protein ImpG
MSDELLPYYHQELAFLRRMGAQFAEAHPKIAGRLRLDPDMAEDPHVARMVEAFAFLNARTRRKLDDDFPEIAEAMLQILYPHYLTPAPSMAIVQFTLNDAQAEMAEGYRLERGTTIETEPIEGQPCRFRTCQPVQLWPLEVSAAEFRGQPIKAPAGPPAGEARAAVRIELRRRSPKLSLGEVPLTSLRFFLHGQSQLVGSLYQLLFCNVLGVVVASSDEDKQAVVLEPSCLRAVGFEREEAALEQGVRSFPGYRLLTEFFSFPQKFHFFEIAGIPPSAVSRLDDTLVLYILLDRHVPELERHVERQTFRLGCTPIVNTFRQRAEPITLTQRLPEYRVEPDARRPHAHEVYSIDRVIGTAPDGSETEYFPFYSLQHGGAIRERAYWHASRRAAPRGGGSDVYLMLVDSQFQPRAERAILDIEITCTNRDLAHRLPFGGGQPRLQVASGAPPARLVCLTPPTRSQRPALRRGTLWRLVSHLSLNHLSLTDGPRGAEALREILRLYDFADSAETRAMIDGLTNVATRRVVGRVGHGRRSGVCRGLEVVLTLDEEKFSGGGLFLMATVLERFLGLYVSLNSFTETAVAIRGREEQLHRWPPRAGERVLL